MIPYGRQSIDDDDIQAVAQVLKGEWLTQGPHVEEFEGAFASAVGAKYAVAYASGTLALHGAAAAADLGPGSRVAAPSLTFVATANCALSVGADVSLVDIDEETLNIDLTLLPSSTDAVVVTHFAGLPVDLRQLDTQRPRIVIEDAAHALGAQTPDGPVGNCARSDLCVFSFHPVKAITTGEGGMITTNSDQLDSRLRKFRNHGITRRPEFGAWYYEITQLSTNARLTDIQAALGTSQLAKLDRFITRRNSLAARYRRELSDMPIVLPPAAPTGSRHAYHLFPIQVQDRKHVYTALRDRGIATQVHYVPLHHHPLYKNASKPDLPHTDAAYRGLLSIPLFPAMTDDEQTTIIEAIREVLVTEMFNYPTDRDRFAGK